jgi:hypothetical protein
MARDIRTSFVYPPIPDRSCDWSAIDRNTYDGEGSPIGWGRTEAEAIADLKEQLEDDELTTIARAVSDLEETK